MSRLELAEGEVDVAQVDALLPLDATAPGDEVALRDALTRALENAAQTGARRVALAPDARKLGFPTQRCAEILIEAAQAAQANRGAPEEIQIVLDGEPTYRIYEAVYDAARIAEQMRRLRG